MVPDYRKFLRPTVGTAKRLDAIYIPTRCPSALKINANWPKLADHLFLIPPIGKEVECPSDKTLSYASLSLDFIQLIASFEHTEITTEYYRLDRWQLPAKRNYAIIHSLKMGFKTIMLLDDDIDLDVDIVLGATALLNTCECVSLPSIDFPDMSSMDHIADILGARQNVFLSGATMLARIHPGLPFFPQVYNEDWIYFMKFPETNICCGGVLSQNPYNPFTEERVRFQEFGELMIEGLIGYETIDWHASKVDKYWAHALKERFKYLSDLRDTADKQQGFSWLKHLLDVALSELASFDAEAYSKFMRALERDQRVWDQSLARIGRQPI